MRKKIKQSRTEIEKIKRKLKEIDAVMADVCISKEERAKQLQFLAEFSKDLVRDNEVSKSRRQILFERLLIKQRKISMYNDILCKRKPFMLYKTEEQSVPEYKKQKRLNENLVVVTESLMVMFPTLHYDFHRMCNTLRVAVLMLYS